MVRIGRIAVVFAGALVAASISTAHASNPAAVYVAPARLDFFPDEANATKVAIHGAFFFLKDPNGFAYSVPMCGYMYFGCPVGSEKLCRLQWADIKANIGQQGCSGFGPQQMTVKWTLHAPGTPLANPDTYDLGMGVSRGAFVDGQCDPAQKLACMPHSTPDMAMHTPADMAMHTPADMAMHTPADMAAHTPADMAAHTPADMAISINQPKTGCAVAARRGDSGLGLFALLAFAALGLVRRRRI